MRDHKAIMDKIEFRLWSFEARAEGRFAICLLTVLGLIGLSVVAFNLQPIVELVYKFAYH
jgi:hypothetical protein